MLLETAIVILALNNIPHQPAAPPKPPTPQLFAVEQNIVNMTNQERRRYGLPPLRVDFRLVDSARRHTIWMVTRGGLTHTSAPVAENIAMGQANTAQAMRSWMGSSGHRANILNRSYTRMGAAAYVSANGTIYWCQQFLH